MYKCTECGLEYDKKPQYCDCGNDEFVLTIENNDIQKNTEITNEPVSAETVSSINAGSIKQTERTHNIKTTVIPSVEPVSLGIFILCLILAFVIVFIWNPAEKQRDEVKETVSSDTVIPAITELWKESQVKPAETVKQEEPLITQPAVNKIKTSAQTTTPQKSVQKQTSKPAKTTATKPTVKQQPSKQTTPVQQSTKVESGKIQTQQTEIKQPELTAEEQQKIIADNAQKLLQAQQDKQEYAAYKINLRNTIGRKIDFTKVIGDGDCIIAFSLNSNGKLIGRTFEKQSDNLTLNDAVYAAVLSTTTFNPPPAAYNNEILRLYISFNNGNFAINLK